MLKYNSFLCMQIDEADEKVDTLLHSSCNM
jgi:hypothetical protein